MVPLYALISSDAKFAVDLFVSKDAAEQTLAEVLTDEPTFEELLSDILIEPPWAEVKALGLIASPDYRLPHLGVEAVLADECAVGRDRAR